jgi:membrane fusion protein (multidrug efflux system)
MKTFQKYLIILLAIGQMLQSCSSQKTAPPSPPVPVNLQTVQMQLATYYDVYPGNVTALSQVDLRPQVEGYITAIFFKEGERVKKGQKLYEIDRAKYLAAYDQALANVKVAESNNEQAQKDADRYVYLNQHDAVAKQTLDHAMTTLQNSKNQVIAAKQDLIKAQTDLKYSIITAPFDGTIGLSQVKIGTLAVVGQTLLNTISTDDPMAVDFVINEKQLPYFKRIQSTKKPVDSLFTILLPDNSLYPKQGVLSVIDRGVDPLTGTIKVRLVFPNANEELKAGMSCRVRVHNTDSSKQIIIPNKAVVEQMGEYFVYVKKDSANAAYAQQRKVTTGQVIGPNIIIKEGLNEGEQLIVDGVQKVRNGAPVNVGKH